MRSTPKWMPSLPAQPQWSTSLQVCRGLERRDTPSAEGLVSLIWLKVMAPALHQKLEEPTCSS